MAAGESSGNVALDAKIKEWLTYDKYEPTRNEISSLVQAKDYDTLGNLLLKRLAFGTAGLRAKMGAGYSCMNDLVIVQTTQGLLKYLISSVENSDKRGVVIGHDARHNSSRFAQLAAAVFLSQGIRVYLFSDIVPTPYVAYGVRHLNCACGIMVTASHNPKQDNGYKVYWDNGAQIIPPQDELIAASITQNLEPWPESWNLDQLSGNALCSDPLQEICTAYSQQLAKASYHRVKNENSSFVFTYTPMHGVGQRFAENAFEVFGLKPFISVTEQASPDPDFPTVTFPNPEEGKSALNLAMATASSHNCTVILANDPDADRLAVAEKRPNGSWHVFSGNEIGALFAWWLWENHKRENPDFPASQVCMMSSTVSSKIIATIASQEGFHFDETLTGFKWMGNLAKQRIDEGYKVLFAFEEAIGFMIGPEVLDKDGISALAAMAEMAVHLNNQGRTLSQQLEDIYLKYGYHIANTSYFICHSAETISRIFTRLRDNAQYPTKCGELRVKGVRDLTTGYDSNQADNKAVLPTSSSQMITFTFEDGSVATLRTSGTEPKIKYYVEVKLPPGGDSASAIKHLEDLQANLVEEFLQPEKNGLIPRATD